MRHRQISQQGDLDSTKAALIVLVACFACTAGLGADGELYK